MAAFSHSSLKDYEQCARKYHEVKVLKKYPFETTEQSIYGNNVHAAIEGYIKAGTPVPPEFAQFLPVVDAVLALPGTKYAEYEMALTPELNVCNFDAPERWVRGIADLVIIDDDNLSAKCVDWKTGADKYADTDQLRLMSLMIFAHFPHIREVKSALIFLVKGSMVKHTMNRSAAPDEWWRYRERVAKLDASYANDVWNPTQSGLCRKHCPVRECPHNGRR